MKQYLLLINCIFFLILGSSTLAETSDTWISEGNKCLEAQSYDKALLYFDQALQLDANSTVAWYLKGTTLYNLGKPKESLSSFRKVLEMDPNFISAYRYQASVLQELRHFQEAIVCLQRADQIAAEWQTQVNQAMELGKYQQALIYIDMLLFHHELESGAWNDKGICLYRMGNYDQALLCFDRSLEKRDNDYSILCNKAACMLALKRYKEAIINYEKSLQLNPRYLNSLQGKAQALEAIGNQTEADAVQKKILAIHRWDSLGKYTEKLRKYTVQTIIVAILLGCICLLISFFAGQSWITKTGIIVAILLAIGGGVLWVSLRLWLFLILAFGIIALIAVLWLFFIIVKVFFEWRDYKNAERERIKKNKDIKEIAIAIEEQISSQEPLENILPKISTKGYGYEAIAKAISSLDSLKKTEKGQLFNNMDSDSISHILNYYNDSEKITILQGIEQEKRDDVLMRFSLSKRSQLSEAPNK